MAWRGKYPGEGDTLGGRYIGEEDTLREGDILGRKIPWERRYPGEGDIHGRDKPSGGRCPVGRYHAQGEISLERRYPSEEYNKGVRYLWGGGTWGAEIPWEGGTLEGR